MCFAVPGPGSTTYSHSPVELQAAGPHPQRRHHVAGPETLSTWFGSLNPPTFRFLPFAFVPADTKARLAFRLCDLDVHAAEAVPSSRLTEIFFIQGSEADAKRFRLTQEPHFVCFNNQLKSIRIPSLVIDVAAQNILLDWRQLCQAFLRDQVLCRLDANSLESWFLDLRRNHG